MNTTIVENLVAELILEDENGSEECLNLEGSSQKIRTKPSDSEIESLYGKFKRGKLLLQPSFQRDFVWDRKKASRLIESILLDVPLPMVYIAEEPGGCELVIDGQQRLTSFFSFLDGQLPTGEPFRLTGLNVLTQLNKKAFKELDDELQDKIRYYTIRVITLLSDCNPDLKFEIFGRLNTGSVPLNDMELRNCVYRGPYMDLLKELVEHKDFLQLLSLSIPDNRMKAIELVLRFASFYHATYLKYKSPMKQFFNRDMERYQYITEDDAKKLRSAFKNSTKIIFSMFGDNAFNKFSPGEDNNHNGQWETGHFNASLYDVLMGVFADKDANSVYSKLDILKEGFIDLMSNNQEFKEAILLGTSSQNQVRKRFDIARHMVEEILADASKQPRCFNRELKQNLYNENPTCTLCGQHIHLLDDAAVDHIEQYWMGGKTIPENARLTHRYCNMARSRKS